MRRRDFIKVIAGSAANWPLAALAQPSDRMPRVGVLMSGAENDPEQRAWLSAFVQGLSALGWTESRNIRVDTRWAAGDLHRFTSLATELVDLKPEAIVATGTVGSLTVRLETKSIPIVFAQVSDPVGNGIVASLAHPGGNVTGFTNYEYAIAGKWLQLLLELTPGIGRVAVIMNPNNDGHSKFVQAVEGAAGPAAIQVTAARVRDADSIERAMNVFAPGPNAGLIVLPDLVAAYNRDLILRLAARYRSPAIYPQDFFAAEGGLIAYGFDPVDIYRRVASYVDRILKGEKPADLPVQAPTKFKLVVNLKTAKALGLVVPQSILTRADEVIE
jgi:putative tryptophan/tyrosine transport system substrate-binding protein